VIVLFNNFYEFLYFTGFAFCFSGFDLANFVPDLYCFGIAHPVYLFFVLTNCLLRVGDEERYAQTLPRHPLNRERPGTPITRNRNSVEPLFESSVFHRWETNLLDFFDPRLLMYCVFLNLTYTIIAHFYTLIKSRIVACIKHRGQFRQNYTPEKYKNPPPTPCVSRGTTGTLTIGNSLQKLLSKHIAAHAVISPQVRMLSCRRCLESHTCDTPLACVGPP